MHEDTGRRAAHRGKPGGRHDEGPGRREKLGKNIQPGRRKSAARAVPRKAKGASPDPMKLLADPEVWQVVRKLLAHKKLRDDVAKLAAAYGDPVDG